MSKLTKRESILLMNYMYLISYGIGAVISAIFVGEHFLLFPFIFIFATLAIFSAILVLATYSFSTKGEAITLAVFCFLTLNIYSGIRSLKMNKEELATKIEKKSKVKTSDNTKKENYISSPAVMTTEDKRIDSIRKYKQLLDEGIITEEEFEKKKKQLLS